MMTVSGWNPWSGHVVRSTQLSARPSPNAFCREVLVRSSGRANMVGTRRNPGPATCDPENAIADGAGSARRPLHSQITSTTSASARAESISRLILLASGANRKSHLSNIYSIAIIPLQSVRVVADPALGFELAYLIIFLLRIPGLKAIHFGLVIYCTHRFPPFVTEREVRRNKKTPKATPSHSIHSISHLRQ
jgi:hypothetical protein